MNKYYEILGVAPGTGNALLKVAYRKLAMKHHPDHGGDAEKFKEVTAAYEILTGVRKPPRQERNPPPPRQDYYSRHRPQGGEKQYGRYHPLDDLDFSEIFRDHYEKYQRPSNPSKNPRPPQDESQIPVRIQLRISDIIEGKVGTVPYVISEDCSSCDGASSKKEVACPTCEGDGAVTESRIRQGIRMNYALPCTRCESRGRISVSECFECGGKGWKTVNKKLKFEIKVKEER